MTEHLADLAVTVEDPLHPHAVMLIKQLSAELAPRYGDDGRAGFTPEDVRVPRAAFVIARLAGQPVGCGALRPLADLGPQPAAEVKRMFVVPDARGHGVARSVLARLEELARDFGYQRIVLETGDRQLEAIRLYERAGYARIPCYGRYAERSWSVCFGKQLGPPARAQATTNLAIRPATVADLPSILAIYNHAVLHTTASYDEQPSTLEQRAAWFEEHVHQDLSVLVADLEREVVGFGALGPFRQRTAYRYTIEHSVYVDAAYRGRGIGRALLAPLITAARERQMHAMVGVIDAANTVSIRLHAAFGFVQVAHLREVGYKFGRWLDLIFMELLLSPTAESQLQNSCVVLPES
jgi:phosphinothricin acetyltransferase